MMRTGKPYFPPLERYIRYVERAYSTEQLTNNGPLLRELEARLAEYLGVAHVVAVANGTLALQLALRALGVSSGSAFTTPFTFVATASALSWERVRPEFVDIDPSDWNIDTEALAARTCADSKAILGVHTYGAPCSNEALAEIARSRGHPLIYDASHAFGAADDGGSLFRLGDVSTVSFHATKVFHTAEGGAVVTSNPEIAAKVRALRAFGVDSYGAVTDIGLNAKLSELHAAMGLAVLDDIDWILDQRRAVVENYRSELSGDCVLQAWPSSFSGNGAYMPILLPSERHCSAVSNDLKEVGIEARRYFYPSLTELPVFPESAPTPVAEDIARRVLCLPVIPEMTKTDVRKVADCVRSTLRRDR